MRAISRFEFLHGAIGLGAIDGDLAQHIMSAGKVWIEFQGIFQLALGVLFQFKAEQHVGGEEARGSGIGGDPVKFGEGGPRFGDLMILQVAVAENEIQFVVAIAGRTGFFEPGNRLLNMTRQVLATADHFHGLAILQAIAGHGGDGCFKVAGRGGVIALAIGGDPADVGRVEGRLWAARG